MNRELKVPAALAILVAGFAAMVYWCGKQEETPAADSVQPDFADVDIEIKDRPHKPHLTGLESSDLHDHDESLSGRVAEKPDSKAENDALAQQEAWWKDVRSGNIRDRVETSADGQAEPGSSRHSNARPLISSRSVSGTESNSLSDGSVDIGSFDEDTDFLNDSDEELYRESKYGRASVPDPIQTTQTAQAVSSEREKHNQHWQVVNETDSRSPQTQNRELPSAQGRMYVIQPGDTLSRIARRFLGAEHRASEIFEANRDVLSDPNSLRVGTQIVIPASQRERKNLIDTNGPVAGNNKQQESRQAKLSNSLFRPVSTSPFTHNVRQTKNLPEEPEDLQAQPSDGTAQYTVVRGDSLEQIALKHYGSRRKAADIYQANLDRLSSPNAIRAGMTLVLP